MLAFEFIMRLLRKIGGDRYTALVKDAVERYLATDRQIPREESGKLREAQFSAMREIFKTDGGLDEVYLLDLFRLEVKFRSIELFLPDKQSSLEYKTMICRNWNMLK